MARCLTVAAVAALTLAVAGPASAAEDPSFTLVNRGSDTIRQLFVTPAGDANWGRNRLDAHPLAIGASFRVKRRIDGNCIMDIRAVFTDGRTEERRALNTCGLDAVAIGTQVVESGTRHAGKPGDDPSFRLVNRGAQPVSEIYATPAGMTNWGQNRLDSGALAPQAEKLIHVAKTGDCLFDLRVVFADHTAKEKHRTDLCKITDLPVP